LGAWASSRLHVLTSLSLEFFQQTHPVGEGHGCRTKCLGCILANHRAEIVYKNVTGSRVRTTAPDLFKLVAPCAVLRVAAGVAHRKSKIKNQKSKSKNVGD
jgi:hypothetical protein